MLSSFKSTMRERRERRERRKSSLCPTVEDEELVIETREHSLRGVIGDEGPSGTAIAGCGSAWTKGFNMDQNLAADHLQKVARASISRVIRMESNNSLELDEDLFSGEHQKGEERSEASDHEESLEEETEGSEQISASAQATSANAEPAAHDEEEASDSESGDEENEESPYDNIRGCQMSSADREGRGETEEDTEEEAYTKATTTTVIENEAVAAK